MNYKPWPFLLLSFFHFIEPVNKIIYYSVIYQIAPWRAMALQWQNGNLWDQFAFYLLFPIAGFALYKVKSWSIYVFLTVQVIVVFYNFAYFRDLWMTEQYFQLLTFTLFGFLNCIVSTYFLLPSVRKYYFDNKLRWWESSPRYQVEWTCLINDEIEGNILNISESGVFLEGCSDKIAIDRIFTIKIHYNLLPIELNARAVHHFAINKKEGTGMQFCYLKSEQSKMIKECITYLEKNNYPRKPLRRDNVNEFKRWVSSMLSSGDGFIPK